MKTQRLFYLMALAAGLSLAACSNGGEKQTGTADDKVSDADHSAISGITVDPAKSRVTWAGESFGMYTHTGTVNLTKSDISVEGGKITGGSFIVDLTSISTTDDNYDAEKGTTPEKLIGHLKSPDFFDVATYPEAKFEITGVEGNTATGLLTIRGITNEEKVENIKIAKEGEQFKITGDLTFDRKKYDVAWDYPVKDMVLSDDVELKVELIGS